MVLCYIIMFHRNEFLKFVHDIDISFMKEDKIMRNELEKIRYGKIYFY